MENTNKVNPKGSFADELNKALKPVVEAFGGKTELVEAELTVEKRKPVGSAALLYRLLAFAVFTFLVGAYMRDSAVSWPLIVVFSICVAADLIHTVGKSLKDGVKAFLSDDN